LGAPIRPLKGRVVKSGAKLLGGSGSAFEKKPLADDRGWITIAPMKSSTSQPAVAGERLKTLEYIGYALGDTASNFFFKFFAIFLTYYYVSVWGIPDKALLWMMPIITLIGAFTDPVMGLIADRTNSRWGKFRPYILFGAIPYGIFGYLMFLGPDLSTNGKIAYAFVTYALMLTVYSVINVPYSSLLGVISPSSRTRSVLSSYRFVGAFAGGLLISLFVRPLVKFLGSDIDMSSWPHWLVTIVQPIIKHLGAPGEVRGFQLTMAIFAVVSVIMFWITFLTTRERVTPPPKQKSNVLEELVELVRNWPWVMLLIAAVLSMTFVSLQSGSTIFFFKHVIGADDTPIFEIGFLKFDRFTIFISVGMLAQVVGTLGLSFLARKLDKKYAAASLCTVTGLCFLTFYFIPKDHFVLFLVINAIAYLAMGPTSALTWALYGDVADYGEWKFGRRSTGLVFSASLFAIKTGGVVGSFLLILFLREFGFDKKIAIQSDAARLGIALAFSLMPGFIALLKAGALMIYPLNQKRVDEIEKGLAERHAADSN
jgi:GPH family glycoside/pentoside/hexuronide:cation symporter